MPWYHGCLTSRTNLLLVLGICACSPKNLNNWPGRSNAPPPEVEYAAVAEPKPPAWSEFTKLDQLALVSREPVPANNHDPFRWNLRVRITPAALPSYLSWHVEAVMPEDTWIVAEHRARQGNAPGPYYFAHKTSTGWEFGVATPEGYLVAPPHAACARCHAEAPADSVFGIKWAPPVLPQIDQRPDGG